MVIRDLTEDSSLWRITEELRRKDFGDVEVHHMVSKKTRRPLNIFIAKTKCNWRYESNQSTETGIRSSATAANGTNMGKGIATTDPDVSDALKTTRRISAS